MHKLKIYIIAVLSGLFIISTAIARPGRNGIYQEYQPDGTTFSIITYGDEFYHVSKTSDGCAVVKDVDGWWYYAIVDENGSKCSTGWKVGSEAPADVISASRDIAPMSFATREKKLKANRLCADDQALMQRIREIQGTKTAAGGNHKHGIVVLAQFKDVKFRFKKEDFVDLLNQKNYNKGGAKGCAKDYFESQFEEQFVFDFDVSNIITLSQNRAYYGANGPSGQDKAPEEMVIEACKKASSDGIDFSIYDQDNDGLVDNVFIFFAGEDEADYPSDIAHSECIWSHAWFLNATDKTFTLNGKTIDRYACTSELRRTSQTTTDFASIGTFCHEFSHTLGLPDYYDTDYEKSHGVGAAMWLRTSLMDGGSQNNFGHTPPYFNALDREILGIGNAVRITTNGTYSMEPIGNGGTFYRIDTDHPDEYYLLECRASEGWDEHIGGNGMLIYHVDKSKRSTGTSDVYNKDLTADERWFFYNEVNAYPAHQCADLVEADGRNDKFNTLEEFYRYIKSISGIFYPRSNSDSFSATSSPAMTFWSGDAPKISISEINKNGKNISFFVSGFEGVLPTVYIDKEVIFQDEALISFSSSMPLTDEDAKVVWGKSDQQKTITRIKPYAPGKFFIRLSDLTPSTSYDVAISIETDKGTSKEVKMSFLTARYYDGARPYINFKGVKRNPDGSFSTGCQLPLKVWNSVPAAKVEWFFDGKAVNADADGYFYLKSGGQLKALVHWKDGSCDVIIKDIIIK